MFNSIELNEVVSDYYKALTWADDGEAGNLAKLHGRLARALQHRGELGVVITEARLALDLAPGNPDASNHLARLLCLVGRYAEPLPVARALPDDKPDFLDALAHASVGAGQWGQAVRAWDQILRLEPLAFESPGDPNCGEDNAHYASALKLLAASFPADLFAPAR